MTQPSETIPGAYPVRNSDNQPADYEDRTYVVTGESRSSIDRDLTYAAPPRNMTQPVRARLTADTPPIRTSPPAEDSTVAREVRGLGESMIEYNGVTQVILQACRLLNAEDAPLRSTDVALLRAAVALFDQLSEMANERIDESIDESSPNMRTPPKPAATADRAKPRNPTRKRAKKKDSR